MGPRLEDFEILDTIGRGTHGIVRKVRRIKDDQILVWKELYYASMSEIEKQGLVLEVNLLRELRHPNIVRFYHHIVDRNSGTLYIFMEHCPGGDLRQLVTKCLKRGTYLEESFIWRVLKQVCEALRTCHEKHVNGEAIVLHRDIKPANVFLDEDGNVKLGDFGLAKTLNSDSSFARTFVGTPYYMSPEVVDGCEYNERSDIWSLGCLIYELCAQRPPFKADNQKDLALKIKAGRFDRIPVQYSNELWEMIGLMLTQDDFLRPTALMILYHSALVANTSPEGCSEDFLGLSISLIDNSNFSKKETAVSDCPSSRDHSTSPVNICSKLETSAEPSLSNSLMETVKERENVISEEEKQMEEMMMKEVEAMMMESKMRKAKKTSALEASIGLRDSTLNRPKVSVDPVASFTKDIKEMQLPPKCICGGMSHEDWRERLSSVRKSESLIIEREITLEEKERELAKREKKILAMEQEVKQTLIRAQIYLRHVKDKVPQTSLFPFASPKVCVSDTDVDATTVSGDIGYNQITTVAFLNTNSSENPFLKMRQKALLADEHVGRCSLSRSNTLDNPKSRKKCGNLFYLDKESGLLNVPKESNVVVQNHDYAKCPNISAKENYTVQSSLCKLVPIENDKVSFRSNHIHNVRPTTIKPVQKKEPIAQPSWANSKCDREPLKTNSANIFTTFRNNFTRNHSSRKSKEILGGKENKGNRDISKRNHKTLKVVKDVSKGVCAKPENNIVQKPRQTLSKQATQNDRNRDKIFRFYNAV